MLRRIARLLRIGEPVTGDSLLIASGASVPSDGTRGYATGCLFLHTDGGEGTAVYVNEGTATICDFNALASLTAAQEALLGAVAGTITASKAVIVDSNKDASTFRNLTATNVKAGASGTAGTVDVFPTTAAKGKLQIAVTDQVGDTTVELTVAAMAAARQISLPDPLAAADILLGKQAAVARTATVDGLTTGTIADAGKLQFVTVTAGGDANSIIVLPTPTPGTIVILAVAATGYELRTSNPATIGINGGTGASAESAIPANTLAVLFCESATSWKGLQLGSDGTLAKVEVAA